MKQQKLKSATTSIAFTPGSAIRGERVVAQFRKIHRVTVVHGTSTHNIQQTKLEGTVLCVIEKPLSHLDTIAPKSVSH
jgi:hypothetical protein